MIEGGQGREAPEVSEAVAIWLIAATLATVIAVSALAIWSGR